MEFRQDAPSPLAPPAAVPALLCQMANLAFRSFTTLGYFAAALLIAIVASLALTSFGDDSSGQQALATATPAPTPVSAGPGGNVSSIGEGIEAAGAGGVVELRAGVFDEFVRITQAVTIRPPDGDVWMDRDCEEGPAIHVYSGAGVLAQETAGNETPDCPLALD